MRCLRRQVRGATALPEQRGVVAAVSLAGGALAANGATASSSHSQAARLAANSVHTANGISVKHVRLAFTPAAGSSSGKAAPPRSHSARDSALPDQASRPPCDVCQQVCVDPPPACSGPPCSAEEPKRLLWL